MAAEALLEKCIHQADGLPDAMDAAGRLLGFDHFCLANSNLDNPAYIVSERQREDIARTRNVAGTTVRKQIAHIFRKLDVHRQVDLVRLLAGLRR